MSERTVLIVGASGVVGHEAMRHFAGLDGWRVVALSRRVPADVDSLGVRHLSVDLMDPAACAQALESEPGITHLVYAALFEKPGLVRGWREADQMQTNLAMFRHVMDALIRPGHRLAHVSLLQGTKAYGVHLHTVPVPAREDRPRDAHENFYWLQEDALREMAVRAGFSFTIFRPQLIFGDVLGVAMNLVPIIGVYGAIQSSLGLPFAFPGGPANVLEATDSRLLARALAWAALAPSAREQTFNITNGDVFTWVDLWPALADALGLPPAEPHRCLLADYLPTQAGVWDGIIARHRLAAPGLSALLGESHHYADFCFGTHARQQPPPVLVSTIKLRQAGFADCIDTEAMFRDWIGILQRDRILPRPA